jgi:outer membrane protein OmpA-like peptidoglycan-associated protein
MSFNLLDAVKNQFSGDLVNKASSLLGESEGGISKALSGIIPSALTGIISKATSGGQGAESILSMAKSSASGGGGLPGGLSGFFGEGSSGFLSKGLDMVKGLFGDKFSGIITAISSFAGIKSSSASSLFSMAAPAAMSSVGSYASQNNLNASGLLSFLNSQKSSILNSLPAGLSSITSLLGMGGAAKAVSSATEDTVQKTGGGMKWLLPLLLIGAALAWWFLLGGKNGCNKQSASTSDTALVKPMDDTAGRVSTSTPESYMVKLPDGTELNAYKGGIEDKLVSFLNTDWMKLGEDSLKKTWFDFDNLNFKTGSAEITAESQQQVNNMVAILKAFPNAKLKIGGYTDKTGNEAANKKLSGERANAVKAAMDKAGVGKQVTGAEGYGSEFAKYPADAPESDRVKDRHVSVSVRGQ